MRRAQADASRPAAAVDCGAQFRATGYRLDPGAAARTEVARGPRRGSDIVWYSRPVRLPGWLLVERGEMPCNLMRVNIDPKAPPTLEVSGGLTYEHALIAELRDGSWRLLRGAPVYAVIRFKQVAACPGPERSRPSG